jgi:hypothetical protein
MAVNNFGVLKTKLLAAQCVLYLACTGQGEVNQADIDSIHARKRRMSLSSRCIHAEWILSTD